jgi:hypothetical protein
MCKYQNHVFDYQETRPHKCLHSDKKIFLFLVFDRLPIRPHIDLLHFFLNRNKRIFISLSFLADLSSHYDYVIVLRLFHRRP